MLNYVVGVMMVSLFGVLGYFGLWLCGMSARPIGYLGAALLAVSVLHIAFAIGRSVKEAS